MTDQRARALIARYDLVDVTRCGESWREMQRDDQYGDWVSYEDHIATLADERRRVWEEAAEVAESFAAGWWDEYKNGLGATRADPHYQGLSDGAEQIAHAIRAKAHAGQEGCRHEWGTDGAHSNEFCKRCFQNKPQEASHD